MYAKMMCGFRCECGSLLVQQQGTALQGTILHHDQYARQEEAPYALIETKPLACKFAGMQFDIPVMELKQSVPK